MTDTAPGVRGGFPEIKPAEHAPAGLGPFFAAMRRLQEGPLAVLLKPDTSAPLLPKPEVVAPLLPAPRKPVFSTNLTAIPLLPDQAVWRRRRRIQMDA